MKGKFLIIGHPKCGSLYMSMLMKEFGYDVGHEEVLKNGICCWENVNNLPQFKPTWGPQRHGEPNFDTIVIHYVRNPFYAIPSIIAENKVPESFEYRRKIIKHHFNIDLDNYDQVGAAIISYVYYNRLAEAQGCHLQVQVEKAHEQVSKYLKLEVPKATPPTNVNTNGSKRVLVNWAKVDQYLYSLINDAALRYGYPSIIESSFGAMNV